MSKELRQLEVVTEEKRFVGKASGEDCTAKLEQLIGYVREGDTIVLSGNGSGGRNLDDLRKIVLGFTEREELDPRT